MALLSEEAKKLGINVAWDPTTKNVTVGDKSYTPDQLKGAGLTLSNGRWQGDTTSLLNPTPQVAPTPTMTSSVVSTPSYQAPDYSSYINSLAEQTKAKNVADLQRAYEKSIGSLNQEQTTIAPKFEQGRSDTRRLAINQAKDFENFLATKGLSASGTAGQGMIQQQGQLLDSIGQSKTAESNAQADIERRRSGLTTDLQYGIQSAQANADLEAARQLMELQNQQDARAYNESLIAKDWAREDAMNAEERARQDFIDNIGAFARDYSAQINKVRNDGDTTNDWQIPFLEQAKQEKIVNENLDPRTGLPLPVDNTPNITSTSAAIDLWQQLGTANQAVANALGIAVGTPYRNTSTGGSSGGIGITSNFANLTPKQQITSLEETLRGTSGSTTADMILVLDQQGAFDNLTPSEVESLIKKFGVTDEMIQQAINRNTTLNNSNVPYGSTGIQLPSGNFVGGNTNQPVTPGGGLYGNLNTIR